MDFQLIDLKPIFSEDRQKMRGKYEYPNQRARSKAIDLVSCAPDHHDAAYYE
jgi:hypothetical protein